MSPPVGWWTCECGDWNSPYAAPTRCGGCNADRGGPISEEISKPTFSYYASDVAPKVKFGASSDRSRVPSSTPLVTKDSFIGHSSRSESSSKKQPLSSSVSKTKSTPPSWVSNPHPINPRRAQSPSSSHRPSLSSSSKTTTTAPLWIPNPDPIDPRTGQASSASQSSGPVKPTPRNSKVDDVESEVPQTPFSKQVSSSWLPGEEPLSKGIRVSEDVPASEDIARVIVPNQDAVSHGDELDFVWVEEDEAAGLEKPTDHSQVAPVKDVALDSGGENRRGENAEASKIPDSDNAVHPSVGADEPQHPETVSVGLSRSSSVVSLADSTFPSMISGSSQSSIADSQAHTEQFSKLVFEDNVLQPVCFAIVGLIPVEIFERKLRRSLRSFSGDLLKEATNLRERQAAKFVKLRARNAAHLICDELNATKQIFKQKQATAPRAWEESSDSDISEDEDGAADIRELGTFILRSKAFRGLQVDLKLFLTQQLSVSLPFDGHDPELTAQECVSVAVGAVAGDPGNVKGRSSLFSALRRLNSYPKLEDGMKRVHWKCSCGSSIYDMYEELEPGAARKFERLLRKSLRTRAKTQAGMGPRGHAMLQNLLSLPSHISKLAVEFATRPRSPAKPSLPSFELRQQQSGRTSSQNERIQSQSLNGQHLFLLLCVNNSIGASRTGLEQPAVHNIDSDKQLFFLLKDTYMSLRRKWWSFLSLWSLQHIFFVHFEMYNETHVDVRELNTIPSSPEYIYEKCKLKPPVGSNTLKHFMQCPESAAISRPCLNRIPKKIGNPLTTCPSTGVSPGWGLYFVEGWNKKKILISSYVVFLSGCVLVLVLCFWKGFSVQDSFAIASFLLAIFGGGVVVFQASTNMT